VSNLTFVRPEADNVESGLSAWAQLLLTSIAGKTGLTVVDLRGPQVTRHTVTNAMSGQHLMIFFLHGTRNALGDPAAYVDSGNVGGLTGAVVMAFACLAGDQLGPDAVAQGARAFLGFDDILTNYHSQPALFGHHVETSVQPFILAGQSIDTVRSALEKSFQQIEQHYRTGQGQNHVNADVIWMAAHINWRGLVLHGDPHAKI
jgi:hypothetical protein